MFQIIDRLCEEALRPLGFGSIVLQHHLEICPWAERQSMRLREEVLGLETGNRLVLESPRNCVVKLHRFL